MAQTINFLLIEEDQRSELIFSFAHHRSGSLRVLVPSEVQKQFFEDVLLNINAGSIAFTTFQEYSSAQNLKEESIFVISAPNTFQIVQAILAKAASLNQTIYFVLLKKNKKYLKMLSKKLGVANQVLQFSSNKFVGINDKLRQLVDKSYDLNRAAFFAYGSFINYFRANLLKKIFRTDQIDVAKLARSFGFTTPPRVKEGKFLTLQAQREKKKQIKAKKAVKKPKTTKIDEKPKQMIVPQVSKQKFDSNPAKKLKVKKIKKENRKI